MSEFEMVMFLRDLPKITMTEPIRFWNYGKFRAESFGQAAYENSSTSDIVMEDFVFTGVWSEWGSNLISVGGKKSFTCDIARVKKVLHGNLVIFVQNDFWRNKYLGMSPFLLLFYVNILRYK
jgi:hypothetical protein